MNKTLLVLYSILAFAIFSCKENSKKPVDENSLENLEPKVKAENLEANFRTWWTYHLNQVDLASEFKSIDENTDPIDKEQALKKLTSGHYIPLKLKSEDGGNLYRLYKLSDTANKSIKNTIKSQAYTILKHFSQEGQAFPEFDFVDLDGNRYTNASIKGKDVFIKTWFINCKACIEEFPELNEFVEQNKNKDILFISLALDPKAQLERFLEKTEFNYKVIPNQKKLITNTLQAQIYPTHYLLDKKGVIQKVENQGSRIIDYYKNTRHMSKKSQASHQPPLK